jgi:hypothetical protein
MQLCGGEFFISYLHFFGASYAPETSGFKDAENKIILSQLATNVYYDCRCQDAAMYRQA